MKKKTELKSVFGDIASVMYQASEVKIPAKGSSAPIALSPEYEFPVTIDTLNIAQDDPTINHYKVVGMQGDWFATATTGDMSIQMTVPTKHGDILKVLFGEDAVGDIKATLEGASFSGQSLALTEKAITGTFILKNKVGDQIMILNNIMLWAKPYYENTAAVPFAFVLTGTMTVGDDGDDANFAWLTKGEPSD